MAPLHVADGTLEAIKWLAVILMTVDHVNKYLLQERVAALFAAGRVAMPLFVFVLAYNLARPSTEKHRRLQRMAWRLSIAAMAATVPYIALGGVVGWWPLNILFTLLASVTIIALLERRWTGRHCVGYHGLHHRRRRRRVLVAGASTHSRLLRLRETDQTGVRTWRHGCCPRLLSPDQRQPFGRPLRCL